MGNFPNRTARNECGKRARDDSDDDPPAKKRKDGERPNDEDTMSSRLSDFHVSRETAPILSSAPYVNAPYDDGFELYNKAVMDVNFHLRTEYLAPSPFLLGSSSRAGDHHNSSASDAQHISDGSQAPAPDVQPISDESLQASQAPDAQPVSDGSLQASTTANTGKSSSNLLIQLASSLFFVVFLTLLAEFLVKEYGYTQLAVSAGVSTTIASASIVQKFFNFSCMPDNFALVASLVLVKIWWLPYVLFILVWALLEILKANTSLVWFPTTVLFGCYSHFLYGKSDDQKFLPITIFFFVLAMYTLLAKFISRLSKRFVAMLVIALCVALYVIPEDVFSFVRQPSLDLPVYVVSGLLIANSFMAPFFRGGILRLLALVLPTFLIAANVYTLFFLDYEVTKYILPHDFPSYQSLKSSVDGVCSFLLSPQESHAIGYYAGWECAVELVETRAEVGSWTRMAMALRMPTSWMPQPAKFVEKIGGCFVAENYTISAAPVLQSCTERLVEELGLFSFDAKDLNSYINLVKNLQPIAVTAEPTISRFLSLSNLWSLAIRLLRIQEWSTSMIIVTAFFLILFGVVLFLLLGYAKRFVVWLVVYLNHLLHRLWLSLALFCDNLHTQPLRQKLVKQATEKSEAKAEMWKARALKAEAETLSAKEYKPKLFAENKVLESTIKYLEDQANRQKRDISRLETEKADRLSDSEISARQSKWTLEEVLEQCDLVRSENLRLSNAAWHVTQAQKHCDDLALDLERKEAGCGYNILQKKMEEVQKENKELKNKERERLKAKRERKKNGTGEKNRLKTENNQLRVTVRVHQASLQVLRAENKAALSRESQLSTAYRYLMEYFRHRQDSREENFDPREVFLHMGYRLAPHTVKQKIDSLFCLRPELSFDKRVELEPIDPVNSPIVTAIIMEEVVFEEGLSFALKDPHALGVLKENLAPEKFDILERSGTAGNYDFSGGKKLFEKLRRDNQAEDIRYLRDFIRHYAHGVVGSNWDSPYASNCYLKRKFWQCVYLQWCGPCEEIYAEYEDEESSFSYFSPRYQGWKCPYTPL